MDDPTYRTFQTECLSCQKQITIPLGVARVCADCKVEMLEYIAVNWGTLEKLIKAETD